MPAQHAALVQEEGGLLPEEERAARERRDVGVRPEERREDDLDHLDHVAVAGGGDAGGQRDDERPAEGVHALVERAGDADDEERDELRAVVVADALPQQAAVVVAPRDAHAADGAVLLEGPADVAARRAPAGVDGALEQLLHLRRLRRRRSAVAAHVVRQRHTRGRRRRGLVAEPAVVERDVEGDGDGGVDATEGDGEVVGEGVRELLRDEHGEDNGAQQRRALEDAPGRRHAAAVVQTPPRLAKVAEVVRPAQELAQARARRARVGRRRRLRRLARDLVLQLGEKALAAQPQVVARGLHGAHAEQRHAEPRAREEAEGVAPPEGARIVEAPRRQEPRDGGPAHRLVKPRGHERARKHAPQPGGARREQRDERLVVATPDAHAQDVAVVVEAGDARVARPAVVRAERPQHAAARHAARREAVGRSDVASQANVGEEEPAEAANRAGRARVPNQPHHRRKRPPRTSRHQNDVRVPRREHGEREDEGHADGALDVPPPRPHAAEGDFGAARRSCNPHLFSLFVVGWARFTRRVLEEGRPARDADIRDRWHSRFGGEHTSDVM